MAHELSLTYLLPDGFAYAQEQITLKLMKRANSASASDHLKHFLIWVRPTAKQMLWYFLVGVALLFASQTLMISTPTSQPTNDLLQNSAFLGFWLIVGMGIYITFWLSRNFITEIGQDLALTRARQRSKNRWRPLEFSLENALFRLCIATTTACYAAFVVRSLVPWCNQLYGQKSTILAIAASLCLMASLHVFSILIKLLLLQTILSIF